MTVMQIVFPGKFAIANVVPIGNPSAIEISNAVKLTRNGETIRYRTVLREDKSNRINALMQAKYTWSDTYIGAMVGGRDDLIPIELHPLL